MVDVNKVIKDAEESIGKTFTDEQRKTIEVFGEFMNSIFPDTGDIIQEPEQKILEINEVISGLDYCLNIRRCIGCEHSEGRMFATCKPLAENALRILKNIEEKYKPKQIKEYIPIGKNLAPICPTCNRELGITVLAIKTGAKKPNYCMYCGQAVKWE